MKAMEDRGDRWQSTRETTKAGKKRNTSLPLCPVGVLNILREDRSKVSCTAESRFSVENAPQA